MFLKLKYVSEAEENVYYLYSMSMLSNFTLYPIIYISGYTSLTNYLELSTITNIQTAQGQIKLVLSAITFTLFHMSMQVLLIKIIYLYPYNI